MIERTVIWKVKRGNHRSIALPEPDTFRGKLEALLFMVRRLFPYRVKAGTVISVCVESLDFQSDGELPKSTDYISKCGGLGYGFSLRNWVLGGSFWDGAVRVGFRLNSVWGRLWSRYTGYASTPYGHKEFTETFEDGTVSAQLESGNTVSIRFKRTTCVWILGLYWGGRPKAPATVKAEVYYWTYP